ncbi:MAG: Outer rane receptor protein mostly Fe transport [Herminiimonas sp.]|nr:Outer rane receptor protein mostly Fe transport [Herminiimonas sp.]
MKQITGFSGILRPAAAVAAACLASPLFAQTGEKTLPSVTVEGTRSIAERNQLPATTESVTAQQAADTVNVMTTEDTLKYLPNILIRRRFIGDTQAPMSSRTTGINASARTLVYADGVPLTTLINNNNQNGSPQWFMVAPEEIDRIDVMYGPFSAAYPGNSYGAVAEIATRMPQHFEAGVKVGLASQNFSQYGTSDSYHSKQASAILGNRTGDWSWWLSANHLDSYSQPVTYLTIPQSTTAAGTALPVVTGAFADRNRTGAGIQVLGAGNLTHTVQDTAKVKLAYDITSSVSAAYTLGYWQNKADAVSQSYLTTAAGAPYFGGSGAVNIAGNSYSGATIGSLFSSNRVEQEHWMQSLSVKTRTQGPWDWEAVVSHFQYAKDITRTSTDLYPAAQTGGAGRISDAGGTNWTTLDLKGTWRSFGKQHIVSFGAHYDGYKLVNPTYNTTDWASGGNGALFTDSRGKTQTNALWAQDVWQLAPSLSATIGGRYESWRASDGFNFALAANGAGFPVNQPQVEQTGFSPKLSLAWQAANQWTVTGSLGKALRFPTVGELYQNVQTGTTFTQANPFLKPESVTSGELAFEKNTSAGKLRVSLFEEQVADALISQTSTIAGVAAPVSFVQNVDKTRQRGIELVMQRKDALIRGLELTGSLTYVDARILANSSYVPTSPGATSVGKRTPYVPDWRATLVATYRPDDKWAYTLAGRYSGRLYATVDNTDINPATYQGFEGYFVADARVRYRFDSQWSAAAGIDNINNRKYFLFHPFPERTIYAELRFDY